MTSWDVKTRVDSVGSPEFAGELGRLEVLLAAGLDEALLWPGSQGGPQVPLPLSLHLDDWLSQSPDVSLPEACGVVPLDNLQEESVGLEEREGEYLEQEIVGLLLLLLLLIITEEESRGLGGLSGFSVDQNPV